MMRTILAPTRLGPAAAVVGAAFAGPARGQVFTESFADITQLPAAGWSLVNQSQPPGPTSWFQGNPAVFPARNTPGYIAANAANALDAGDGLAARSDWLILPPFTLSSGDTLVFWTRTAEASPYPDRLQVRLSASGASANVGGDAGSVGDFSLLLLDLNGQMTTRDYPDDWTRYAVQITGLAVPTSGRLAFRYYLPAGSANLGNYIGIGNVEYDLGTPPPCYANCDGSTTPPVLTVADFSCFLNRFAAGNPYANCDGSTTPPVLNVADFACFLNLFAAGCS